MKKQLYIALYILLTVILSGCGSKRYDLTDSPFMTGIQGTGKIVVAVSDERSFVVSGEKESTYIGRQFSGFGIPAPVFTRSGRTVAEDFSKIVCSSLNNNGFNTESVFIGPGEELSPDSREIADLDYDRAILISIKEFKAEAFYAVELKWSFVVEIYDADGELLASESDNGVDDAIVQNYGGIISGRQGIRAVTGKLGGILMNMFSAPNVRAALSSIPAGEYVRAEKRSLVLEQNEVHENEEISVLKRYLESGQTASFRNYSIQISKKSLQRQADLDQLAEIIWNGSSSRDSVLVDGLCYLCRTFMRSRQPRYRLIFERIKEYGETRKLRGYASKTLKYILPADVPQFMPDGGDVIAQEA